MLALSNYLSVMMKVNNTDHQMNFRITTTISFCFPIWKACRRQEKAASLEALFAQLCWTASMALIFQDL
jgi:hypothetical protein